MGLFANALQRPVALCTIGCIAIASSSDAFICRSSSIFGNAGSHRQSPFESASSCALHASSSPPVATAEGSTVASSSIAERCYDAWNRRNMPDATACFADEFAYDDGQYLGTVRDKSELERSFRRIANALPPRAIVVVDRVAVCPASGNVGTQWHAEREDGSAVPFTRGCSFYTVDAESGLIETAFKVSEMIVKPSKRFSDALVSSASKMMRAAERLPSVATKEPEGAQPTIESGSIIETYFEAWNRRDMESALDCFVDDCTYGTEDPVFVDEFRGKDALREHLARNAEALPSACRIVLDDLAVDPVNGTSGVRWHLEANGVSVPNLRGCSMYETDEASGLLKFGFDVTEAPVKLPGVARDLLAVPFGKLLF